MVSWRAESSLSVDTEISKIGPTVQKLQGSKVGQFLMASQNGPGIPVKLAGKWGSKLTEISVIQVPF